ncbi:hypothetical protein Agabi119p4_10325 [Agaricus bisporus var. burnettii]|uniref:Methyltransferase domain-containing protein n=1 Tax=Agaricus bisporus var. burnettii TaxID=192524 RepID=A0A8H7EWC5_AGABI|nr:hypothetical protein Agabi119p4_10325 [Agaricus bisporus var. burnettii]
MEDPSGLYNFPKGGEPEFGRLDIQHRIWLLSLEGLIPPEIETEVSRHMEQTKGGAILDVGCGSAIWSAQMAEKFPSAQVVAVDITEPSQRSFPSNFSFKSHNLANGLPSEFEAGFDIIHCRAVLQHVPDPQILVDSMAKCLKPGGFLFLVDVEVDSTFDENRKRLEPFIYDPALSVETNLENSRGLSWTSGWLHMLGLSTRSSKYKAPPSMIQQSESLNELMAKVCWFPIGWEDKALEHGRELGELSAEVVEGLFKLSRDSFKKVEGVPPEIKDALIERGRQEFRERNAYLSGWYVVARKVKTRSSSLSKWVERIRYLFGSRQSVE